MDINQQQITTKDKFVDKRLLEEGNCRQSLGASKQQQQQQQSSTSPAASPPSSSSSPSHEFSFTISLHSSSTPVPADKTSKTPPSFAVDLTPADDIFFHGHLLPLHLLSHLPVSPRSSTNSLDSFTLPIRELIDDQKPDRNRGTSTSDSNIIINSSREKIKSSHREISYNENTKGRAKSKSFSLFGFTRWKKGYDDREGDDDDNNKENNKQKKRRRFDVSHVIKKYVRMVRPLLFRGRRENLHFHRQPYSFSGNLSFRNKKELMMRGRRGEFSAPASIRTSPSNSGLLLATTTLPSSTSDSTMEELQAAIQAAIAHCKNSIAVEEKLKC